MIKQPTRISLLIQATALSAALVVCSPPSKSTRAPSARRSSAPWLLSPSGPEATSTASGLPTRTGPSAPPPEIGRDIQGYFRNIDRPETLHLSTGANDTQGWEWMTKLQAEIDGQTVYSMAVSTVRLTGVCRSAARGFDQVLLSFHRKPPRENAAAVLWYDAARSKFALEFIPDDVMRDPGAHFICSGGRSLLPDEGPAVPCLCPWDDAPACAKHRAPAYGAFAAATGGPRPAAREILISPEQTR